MAHLDHAVYRVDAHQTGDAGSAAGRAIDDGVKQWVVGRCDLVGPGAVGVKPLEGPVGQVGPVTRIPGLTIALVQLRRMLVWIERFQSAVPTFERRPRRKRPRGPARQPRPDGLTQPIEFEIRNSVCPLLNLVRITPEGD